MHDHIDLARERTLTEPGKLGPTKSIGVGLREREINEIDALAERLGFSRNAIMAWMIRHLMRQIREGKVEIPIVTKTEVKKHLGDP